MKRSSLLRHLRKHGCILKREGAAHSLWMNPATGAVEAVPRHTEVSNQLEKKSAVVFPFQNVSHRDEPLHTLQRALSR